MYAALIALVVFRSALFAFRLPLDFDSDEAVFGLMAKHLAEGRAFPLFMYGQNYILAVEAWLAAPLFFLFGPSVAALKAPLFAINIAVGLLLVWLLERECGLRPLHGLVSSLFFVLAPPGTVGTLMAASGGNVEPFLYILLLWMVRRRPVWFGLIAGLGFLHREFTIYGVLAVILVGTIAGTREGRDAWRVLGRGLRVAGEVWLVVQFLRPFASAAGPGTTMASIVRVPTKQSGRGVQPFLCRAGHVAARGHESGRRPLGPAVRDAGRRHPDVQPRKRCRAGSELARPGAGASCC